jgi:hypothetical protein
MIRGILGHSVRFPTFTIRQEKSQKILKGNKREKLRKHSRENYIRIFMKNASEANLREEKRQKPFRGRINSNKEKKNYYFLY